MPEVLNDSLKSGLVNTTQRTSVAYVLLSFPLPSETFIAEEILSLYHINIQPHILYLKEGDRFKVHPSAQTLLDKTPLMQLGDTSRLQAMGALLQLLVNSPLRVLGTFAQAMKHPQRWRYTQVLPAAVWCLRNGVQFLHAHFADENFVSASIISAWTGIPYGVTTHHYDVLKDPINKDKATELFHKAALVVTISEYKRRLMAEKYNLSQSRMHVVHCGIDLERFAFIDRQQYQVEQPFRLLNVARMVPDKAQDVLLKAVKLVKKQGVPIVLEIIGDGPQKNALKNLAEDLNILDCVIFHGIQTEAFVKERHAIADMFVLSSHSEGIPVACIEALALGTPAIASRISGIPELIEDEVSGWLVPADDPQLLADAIHKAYVDPAKRQTIAVAGRRVVEKEFERNACTNQLVQLWQMAIKENGY